MTWPSLRVLLVTTPPEPDLRAVAAASLDAMVLQGTEDSLAVSRLAAARPEVPLIVLADTDADASLHLVEAGADEVLPSAAPATDVLSALQHALERKQRGAALGIDEPAVAEDTRDAPPRIESIGRLADGVAQDFNNLLMIIEGNAERLLAAMPAGDPQRERVGAISFAARRGVALTQKLLAFGRRPPAAIPADPNSIVSDSVPPPAGAPHVLLVEDEDEVRELLVDVLNSHGLRVTSVASAEEALAVQAPQPFDLLLTDVSLPGASGPDLAREVRQRWPRLPVLFISGQSGDIFAADRELDSPRGFLQKPFSSRALVASLNELLRTPR